MDFDTCKKRGFIKEIEIDPSLVNSLRQMSEDKFNTSKLLPIKETTISTIFCIVYDSLRESLEAQGIKNGLKIYNHECFTCFIKEILKLEKESVEFDFLRKTRNSINYYGSRFSKEEIKNYITIAIKLRNKFK